MLRIELSTHLARLRTLVALALLAAVPVVAAVTTASHAGHRNGTETGLFGAGPYSALNHAAASLAFVGPLLLPLVVALLATAIASSDRDWGTLRYLYVQPVGNRKLVGGKLAATGFVCLLATATALLAGLAAGLVLFGWHPFHIIGSPNLSSGAAIGRMLESAAFMSLCMLSIGAISFAFGLMLPRGPEALAASVAFVVVASILNGQSQFDRILNVHYWQDWNQLLEGGSPDLLGGVLAQLGWIIGAALAAALVLSRRDPAA